VTIIQRITLEPFHNEPPSTIPQPRITHNCGSVEGLVIRILNYLAKINRKLGKVTGICLFVMINIYINWCMLDDFLSFTAVGKAATNTR